MAYKEKQQNQLITPFAYLEGDDFRGTEMIMIGLDAPQIQKFIRYLSWSENCLLVSLFAFVCVCVFCGRGGLHTSCICLSHKIDSTLIQPFLQSAHPILDDPKGLFSNLP